MFNQPQYTLLYSYVITLFIDTIYETTAKMNPTGTKVKLNSLRFFITTINSENVICSQLLLPTINKNV